MFPHSHDMMDDYWRTGDCDVELQRGMAVGFVLGDKGLSARKQIVGTRIRTVADDKDCGYRR